MADRAGEGEAVAARKVRALVDRIDCRIVAVAAIGAVAHRGGRIAPPTRGRGAGARGVFPFGLGRQAIGMMRPRRQPRSIGGRIVPRHACHRLVVALCPARAGPGISGVWPVAPLARDQHDTPRHRSFGRLDERRELAARDMVDCHGEPADGDIALRVLERGEGGSTALARGFRLCRADRRVAGGDGDHLRREGLVAKRARRRSGEQQERERGAEPHAATLCLPRSRRATALILHRIVGSLSGSMV